MSRFIQPEEKDQNFKPIQADKPTKPAPGSYTSEQLGNTKPIYSGNGGKY